MSRISPGKGSRGSSRGGITIETNSDENNVGFFDEKFGQWEDDLNSPLHLQSHLDNDERLNNIIQETEKRTYPDTRTRSSSSSRRARNSRQKNNGTSSLVFLGK